ncbi:TPA: RNA-directed DNA polymerase [Pseudomonas aeruginosa]|nr:RNA-directed DNA polymerase [Pseudomonas aeruginosa]HEP9383580.1 retron St85 family RNA-directed DNA polymerase [Pseudomonas aeruginosa]
MSKFELRLRLCRELLLTDREVARLISRAPYTYKVYSIPKKNGGRRVVAQPARETKILQNFLIENIFKELPVHECATAYKAGSSIAINASIHVGNSYISKFDFSNFFPSITMIDLVRHIKSFFDGRLDDLEIVDIARVCCIKDRVTDRLHLSIGAPSSPILSNSIMYFFDVAVHKWSSERGVSYTRYADDMTFSTNEKSMSREIELFLVRQVEAMKSPRLSINHEKTIHLSKRHQRKVTGLVLSSEGKVSLGRNRKREISSLIHRFALGQLDPTDVFRLQGLLGFANDAEPDFVVRMRKKYGDFVIAALFEKRKAPSVISDG